MKASKQQPGVSASEVGATIRSQPHPGCHQACYGSNVDHLPHTTALLYQPSMKLVPLSSFPSLSLKQLLLNREKAEFSPPHESLNPGRIPTLPRRTRAFPSAQKCLIASLKLSLTQTCSRSSTGACSAIRAKAVYPIVLYCSGQNHFPPALKQFWYFQPRAMRDSTPHTTSRASAGCSSAEPSGRIQLLRVKVAGICVREAASGKSLGKELE